MKITRTPWKAAYAAVTVVVGLFYGMFLLSMASAAAGIGLLAVLALLGSVLMVVVVPAISFFSARAARICAFFGATPMFVSGLMGLYEAVASDYELLDAVVMILPAAVVLVLSARRPRTRDASAHASAAD